MLGMHFYTVIPTRVPTNFKWATNSSTSNSFFKKSTNE